MHKVVRMGLFNLEKAWESVHKVAIKAVRTEINTQLATIALPDDTVIVVTLRVEFGFSVGHFHLCIPYAVLEPIREHLLGGF